MTNLEDVSQKIKGKAQKVKGEIQQQSGQGLKGGMSKIKGTVNDKVSDMKMNTDLDPRK